MTAVLTGLALGFIALVALAVIALLIPAKGGRP
jgi:hypothetical protein